MILSMQGKADRRVTTPSFLSFCLFHQAILFQQADQDQWPRLELSFLPTPRKVLKNSQFSFLLCAATFPTSTSSPTVQVEHWVHWVGSAEELVGCCSLGFWLEAKRAISVITALTLQQSSRKSVHRGRSGLYHFTWTLRQTHFQPGSNVSRLRNKTAIPARQICDVYPIYGHISS